MLGSKEKALLVEIDIVIDEDFRCKTQWNSVVSNTAFGGGIGAGGALAAIAVAGAFIPVAGWIVSAVCVGALALGAIAGALYGYFTNKRKCSNLLGSVGSSWQLRHPTVKFDGHSALTKRSFIQCQEGGQLLPFVSAKPQRANRRLAAHSELRAYDKALKERRQLGITVNENSIKEMNLHNRDLMSNAIKKNNGVPPVKIRCPHCSFLTDGITCIGHK